MQKSTKIALVIGGGVALLGAAMFYRSFVKGTISSNESKPGAPKPPKPSDTTRPRPSGTPSGGGRPSGGGGRGGTQTGGKGGGRPGGPKKPKDTVFADEKPAQYGDYQDVKYGFDYEFDTYNDQYNQGYGFGQYETYGTYGSYDQETDGYAYTAPCRPTYGTGDWIVSSECLGR